MNKQIKSLYDLGLAIIWLKPRDKMPVESKWTTGDRHKWSYLADTHKKNYNVGTRLGKVSAVKEGYSLAVIDCDVKSDDKKHLKQMEKMLHTLGVPEGSPVVVSGRGNGSRHIYVLVKDGTPGGKLAVSEEKCKVMMPSVPPSGKDRAALKEKDIDKGYRSRNAWELDLLVDGRQVVLPPSIHPDTGKEYKWLTPFTVNTLKKFKPSSEHTEAASKKKVETTVTSSTEFKKVKIKSLPVSDEIKDIIRTGGKEEDRSAALLKVSLALLGAGVPRQDVLSILTEPDTYLGSAGYDHAKTTSRVRAAKWIERYTMAKAESKIAEERSFEDAEDLPELSAHQAEAQLARVVSWRSELETFPSGMFIGLPRPSFSNFVIAFEKGMGPALGRNMVRYRDEWIAPAPWADLTGKPLGDEHIPYIKKWLEDEVGFPNVPTDILFDAIAYVAQENAFDPLREYLEGLEWDGKPRIHKWLHMYCGAVGNKQYIEAVAKKFLVGMVTRAMEPGCKFDTVLILEGEQGTGKSTLARVLGGEFFTDTEVKLDNKDTIQALQGCWVVELGELSAMKKAEVEEMKHFLTKQRDDVRLPYARLVKEFPRRFVIIGTTNNTDEPYLKDHSGNRRYLPVLTTGAIYYQGLKEIRDQLFAEAMSYYLLGTEKTYMDTEKLKNLQKYEVSKREYDDPLMVDIQKELPEIMKDKRGVTARKVWDLMNPLGGRPQSWDLQRIGVCMKKLGFSVVRVRDGEIRERRYRQFLVQGGPDEVVEKYHSRKN